jgi:hypothetical protein
MMPPPTDEELSAAVQKIAAVVRESIADFKAAAPALVQSLSREEWEALKRREDHRRAARGRISKQTLSQIRRLSDPNLTDLLWFISANDWQRASRELLPAFIKTSRDIKTGRGK